MRRRLGWLILPLFVGAMCWQLAPRATARSGPRRIVRPDQGHIARREPSKAKAATPVSADKAFWRELEGTFRLPRTAAIEEVYRKTAARLALTEAQVADLKRRVDTLRALERAGGIDQSPLLNGRRSIQRPEQATEADKIYAWGPGTSHAEVRQFFEGLSPGQDRDLLVNHTAIWLHFVLY